VSGAWRLGVELCGGRVVVCWLILFGYVFSLLIKITAKLLPLYSKKKRNEIVQGSRVRLLKSNCRGKWQVSWTGIQSIISIACHKHLLATISSLEKPNRIKLCIVCISGLSQ
jgi:hypothetical protein